MITYKQVKKLVEKHCQINDIGLRRRYGYLVDARSIYYELCKIHITSYHKTWCSKVVNTTHCCFINSEKTFPTRYKMKDLRFIKQFEIINYNLLRGKKDPNCEELELIVKILTNENNQLQTEIAKSKEVTYELVSS